MISTKTKTVALIALATLIISGGIFGVLLYGASEKRAMFHQEAQERAEALATQRQSDALVDLVDDTAAERDELESYVLAENSVIDFLGLIEGLAKERGVAIETRSISVASMEDSERFERLTLTVEVHGQYVQVSRILDMFETLPFQIDIRSAVIERTNSDLGPWSGVFDMRITKFIGS